MLCTFACEKAKQGADAYTISDIRSACYSYNRTALQYQKQSDRKLKRLGLLINLYTKHQSRPRCLSCRVVSRGRDSSLLTPTRAWSPRWQHLSAEPGRLHETHALGSLRDLLPERERERARESARKRRREGQRD